MQGLQYFVKGNSSLLVFKDVGSLSMTPVLEIPTIKRRFQDS